MQLLRLFTDKSLTDVLLQVKLYAQNVHTMRITKKTSTRQAAYANGLCFSAAFPQPDMRSSIGLTDRKGISVSYKGNYHNAGSRKVRLLSNLHAQQLTQLCDHRSHNHLSKYFLRQYIRHHGH